MSRKNFEQRFSGGDEEGGVGHQSCMPPVGGPLGKEGTLHVLAAGGGTMVAGGAHHDDLGLP